MSRKPICVNCGHNYSAHVLNPWLREEGLGETADCRECDCRQYQTYAEREAAKKQAAQVKGGE